MPARNPLLAAAPHPALGAHADDFARLVGSWAGAYRDFENGVERTGEMEMHLSWVLDGRAVQDVWIVPSLSSRAPDQARAGDIFGATMRIYDPAIEAWRMFWFNPAQPYVRAELIGRRVGDDIVQIGAYGDTAIKWVFSEITSNSFVWTGYWLGADGETWNQGAEFRVRRQA